MTQNDKQAALEQRIYVLEEILLFYFANYSHMHVGHEVGMNMINDIEKGRSK